MEFIIKISALALTAAAACLLIKKTNPEMSILLTLCTVTVILTAGAGFLSSVRELAEAVMKITGSSAALVTPVLKCVAIAIITKITAELCRDAAQSSAAAAVELAGTVCALGISMPLIMSVLNMIGTII